MALAYPGGAVSKGESHTSAPSGGNMYALYIIDSSAYEDVI